MHAAPASPQCQRLAGGRRQARAWGRNMANRSSGRRPVYRAEGTLSDVRNVVVLDPNMFDDTFANAPVDWQGDGTWAATTRWACSPEWSFLGGWSRGDAVLWHKKIFTGDHSLLAFVGPKMEYPRAREPYDLRFRDFGVTICGDGHNPRSGYAAIYGAADQQGQENQRTVLLRNGVEVAPRRFPRRPSWKGDTMNGMRSTGASRATRSNSASVVVRCSPIPTRRRSPAAYRPSGSG